ncbi:MAG: lipoprotein signal peptidase [Gammaproteobacteria bacterium]|nr:lipoprotein signal peptidase [Gammaproteobacteria bacterium]NIR98054.1 lipoprotein signal peptidase [Gammaproteobacteria bacterium]NIT63764.1 lipoprotein signal peptidase [Gammaproteobacteria bacterium]NIV20714.1 lipoprotein signal peptidase [Gammaproteobacteria bacterium]NIY32344.1 lipoprotein signal peptidase [Gammaproteobacteria bacterium]
MLRWLWLSLAVVVLDQATKYSAEAMLELHRPVAVLPLVNLALSYNTGAAFSFLSGAGGWQRWFFAILAAAVATVIVIWMSRLSRRDRWLAAALALIAGGAVGNLIDRLVHGHVIDFIDVYYAHWHWPTFNLADSAITVGVIVLIADGLLGGSRRGT